MGHRLWRNLFLTLSVSVIAAACSSGPPAAPSVDPPPFSGQWRGRYSNTTIDVMSRCRGEGRPFVFFFGYVSGIESERGEMMVDISSSLAGTLHIDGVGFGGTLTCPFVGRLVGPIELVATVAGPSCTPPNVRAPRQGYSLLSPFPIPLGCRRQPEERGIPEPWAELRSLSITATYTSPSSSGRGYPILTVLTDEEGYFHDPAGYYTGTYTATDAVGLTHPDDPRFGYGPE